MPIAISTAPEIHRIVGSVVIRNSIGRFFLTSSTFAVTEASVSCSSPLNA